MRGFKLFIMALLFAPCAVFGAYNNEFAAAAQLLAAAKNADIQQVQALVNNGANINYVDSTGLSIVCTALMNNDLRAAQILQMYGADASKCDRQIKAYKNKSTSGDTGGLFSGLSSAQGITLAAAGAAVVVGGALLLTKVFDPSDDDKKTPSGNRGEGGNTPGGGGDVPSATGAFAIGYGPAYLTSNGQVDKANYKTIYDSNLESWGGTSSISGRKDDYNYFKGAFLADKLIPTLQNYLLIMHGYSALASDYYGQKIFRDEFGLHNPKQLQTSGTEVKGGKPVIVSMITENGVNPWGSLNRSEIVFADSVAGETTHTVDKFVNYTLEGASGLVQADKEQAGYDLSGAGTALNPWADQNETALGKIIAGGPGAGRSFADLYGFVPYGQIAVYRTGGGSKWKDVENPTGGGIVATLNKTGTGTGVETDDEIKIGDKTYTISLAKDVDAVSGIKKVKIAGTTYWVGEDSKMMLGTSGDDVIGLYLGTDGFYYLNTTGKNEPDSVWVLDNENFYTQKTKQDSDIKTFTAMYNAINAPTNLRGSVVANLTLNPASYNIGYTTVSGIKNALALTGISNKQSAFQTLIDNNYSPESETEGVMFRDSVYNYSVSNPMIVMPAGAYMVGGGTGETLTATFENYAPALYSSQLNHMFMTVVAVQHVTDGPISADTIAGYGDGVSSGGLFLSVWNDDNNNIYSSRRCGVAGSGTGSTDPWCFAAAGPTSEMATASAAGAVAAVQSAFSYLHNDEVFTLLALTADGAYLATDDRTDFSSTRKFTSQSLAEYLQTMYIMPQDMENVYDLSDADEYLRAFKEVYGYGMINLERATKPGRSVYFYDGNKIESAKGDAYWRAATTTAFNLSAPFGARGETVSAPFYDVLTSIDGELSMPRVWENEFTIGADDARGLYMGDVLGDLKTRNDSVQKTQIGNMRFSLARSERAYDDRLGGLDNLSIGYENEQFNLSADYQRYFTDGESRFSGLSNPVLGLASNVITSGAEYKYGSFAFGGRVFSGAITDETFLQNDPTITSQYEPLRLGLAQGVQSSVSYNTDKFNVTTAFGFMHETNTLLGAQTSGLLNMGNGDTTYLDINARYSVNENVAFTLRSTFAQTRANPNSSFITGMSELDSDAFAFGADIGNFNFTVSRPLALSRGSLKYAHAQYDVVGDGNGHYDLVVSDMGLRDLSLAPEKRETRFMGSYRHNFGEFTDGAIGFIYRVNPNNTDEFGNESIFMLKMTHRLGI